MTRDTLLAAHLQRCEQTLARLILACIDNGALTPRETRELRSVSGELMALGCEIDERRATLADLPGWSRDLGRASTRH
jgi:hypothetical protein